MTQIKTSSLPFFEISSPQEYPLYGSSRLGIFHHTDSLRLIAFNSPGFDADGSFLDKTAVDTLSQTAPSDSCGIAFSRGGKRYELSNHLGNVLAVISDRKLQVLDVGMSLGHYFAADIWSARDYYPFGMGMGGRSWQQNDSYRFDFYGNSKGYPHGFNGKRQDAEIFGEGNAYDFGARMYDPRIGRWLSRDPLEAKYPNISPYVFSGNNPILFLDYDGNDFGIKVIEGKNGKPGTILITANIYTVSEKTNKQATKAAAQWNAIQDRTVTIGEKIYKLSFEVNVKPPSLSNEEISKKAPQVIKKKRKKGKIKYDSEILDFQSFKYNYLEAQIEDTNDPIGNLYLGNRTTSGKLVIKILPDGDLKETGGYTIDNKFVTMKTFKELSGATKDLGNYTDLIAHEFGHLFGLDDKGATYYSEYGIMKYSGFYLKPIHSTDIENVLKLTIDYFNAKEGRGIDYEGKIEADKETIKSVHKWNREAVNVSNQ